MAGQANCWRPKTGGAVAPLRRAFLPPALVEDIVAGRQPVEMTAETLSRSERPMVWAHA